MGRLASIQPVLSAILNGTSHSDISLIIGGPFYSIYDWLPKHGTEDDSTTVLFNLPAARRVSRPPCHCGTPSPKASFRPHGQGTSFVTSNLSNHGKVFTALSQLLSPRYCFRARSATPVSKPVLPDHCQIASKFGKSGVFETGPWKLAGPGFETGVVEQGLKLSSSLHAYSPHRHGHQQKVGS